MKEFLNVLSGEESDGLLIWQPQCLNAVDPRLFGTVRRATTIGEKEKSYRASTLERILVLLQNMEVNERDLGPGYV